MNPPSEVSTHLANPIQLSLIQETALPPGITLFGALAEPFVAALLTEIMAITALAPLRQMTVRGGRLMSVAMSNCGTHGWTANATGYSYTTRDPLTDRPWPALPALFLKLAQEAAAAAGFSTFNPDVCLINRYAIGTKMGLHQDQDERDLTAPVVSISLGLPAIFQIGGLTRRDKIARVKLTHGDVIVWGGAARLIYHGVLPLQEGKHPATGAYRYNLTLRKST